EPTLIGLLQTMVIFGNVWWMYGGYAWLTNAVPPRELGVRLLLLVGMSGFLLIALAIPTAFGAGGIAFGVGYMIVTLVHTGVFMRTSQQSAIQALTILGPSNVLTAVLLLAAGFTTGGFRWTLFVASFVLHWATPLFGRTAGFRIRVGIVVVAAGMKLAVVAYNEPAALSTALFLATGVAAYATGLVLFRWLLHSGPISVRLAIAVLVLPTALIGIAFTPLAQLAAVVAI